MRSLLLGTGVSAPRDGVSATRDRGGCSGGGFCLLPGGCVSQHAM